MFLFIRTNLGIILVVLLAVVGTVWTYHIPYGPESLKLLSLNNLFLILETRILPIIILLFILLIFWGYFSKDRLRFLPLLLIGVLLFGSLSFSPVLYTGFYEYEPIVNSRWMKKRAEITFYSESYSKTLYFKIEAYKYLKPSILKIIINEKLIWQSDEVAWKENEIYLFDIPLKKGKNKIILESGTGCVYTWKEEPGTDFRCLSFLLSDFALLDFSELPQTIFTWNWYRKEEGKWGNEGETKWRWMSNNAILTITSPQEKKINLTGILSSFNNLPRELVIYQLTKDRAEVYRKEVKYDLPLDLQVELDKGINKFEFIADPDCQTSELDPRCLSIVLRDFQAQDFYDEENNKEN